MRIVESAVGRGSHQKSTHHDIDDENGDVAEGRTTSTEVSERLVTRSVNDEQSGELVLLEVGLWGGKTRQ